MYITTRSRTARRRVEVWTPHRHHRAVTRAQAVIPLQVVLQQAVRPLPARHVGERGRDFPVKSHVQRVDEGVVERLHVKHLDDAVQRGLWRTLRLH